jgi:hypothetical protein
MKIESIVLKRQNEEHLKVYFNDTYVGSANHDEDGWQGMGKVEDMARSIAKLLDIEIVEVWDEDDTD